MRRKNVKRFTVELDPEDYELLVFLARELHMTKADIVRTALRRYFSEWVTALHASELKVFLDFVRAKLREQRPTEAG